MEFTLESGSRLTLIRGDITTAKADVIVNAANPLLLGGGGVDGALHAAAGPELLEACRRLPRDARGLRCPFGDARITAAGRLDARWVVHAVGPRYHHEAEPAKLLASAYRQSLELANAKDAATIAFPALSCGAYGYPKEEAARIAIEACRDYLGAIATCTFYLFDESTLAVFARRAQELLS